MPMPEGLETSPARVPHADPANGTIETLRRLGGSEDCTMACSGAAAYTCGGPWAVSLYTLAASSLDIQLPPYRTEALGCFGWVGCAVLVVGGRGVP
jgi:hypothetical protein